MKPTSHSDLLSYTSYASNGQFGVICLASSPTGVYPLHRHDYIEVEYLAQGCIDHELNGVAALLSPGDCYGLGLHDLHRFNVREPVLFHNLCISPGQVDPVVRRLLMTQPFPFSGTLSPESLSRVNAWFRSLSALLQAPPPFASERITAYLLLILTEIFSVSHPMPEPDASCYRYVHEALDWISGHYAEPLTLNRLAEAVHLSPCYLSTLFSEYVGCSFIRYLTRVRIEKAQERLIDSDASVTAIAFDCGFGSFSSFTRTFRRYTGQSAQEFRRKWRP